MSTDINLYKINNVENFKNNIDKKYKKHSINEDKLSEEEKEFLNDISLTLYYFKEKKSEIKWEWIANKFDVNITSPKSRPKAILLINKDNNHYAISFGYSYHFVGKYADTDWPLEFADRMDYYSIKSVGIFAPNSVINKKIYNYFNYNNLDADIGEALTKITSTLDLDEQTQEYISNYIIIGNSIKFRIKLHNLKSIMKVVNYVEIIMLREARNNIPKLKECKNKDTVKKLDKKLVEKIQKDITENNKEYSINLSEFIIIGFDYIFLNSEYDSFVFELNNKIDQYPELTTENIYQFIKEQNLEQYDNLLNIKISMFTSEETYRYSLRDLIMYADDDTIFNEGTWYEYNSVFFDYINKYLEDIPVYHHEQYDFPNKKYSEKTFDELKKQVDLGNTIYFEYKFNNYVAFKEDNMTCLDRVNYYINGQKYEFTDLLDESKHRLYATKIGNYSNELSYVIDQSLMGLKALDEGKVENYNKSDVEEVGLWLVFKRDVGYYKIENNKLEWEDMDLLIFKSKIADWKKQVLLTGRKPVININYRYKN